MNKIDTGLHLILGGARSGKSRLAQERAEQWLQASQAGLGENTASGATDLPHLTYLATATAGDDEMSSRIDRHKAERDQRWQTIEEPIALAETLAATPKNHCVLVDCLTLWLSNCLHRGVWERERQALLDAIDQRLADKTQTSASWILVSNEVGSGIVPLGQLSREFVDAAGWLHQALAQRADSVTLVIAGLPLQVK